MTVNLALAGVAVPDLFGHGVAGRARRPARRRPRHRHHHRRHGRGDLADAGAGGVPEPAGPGPAAGGRDRRRPGDHPPAAGRRRRGPRGADRHRAQPDRAHPGRGRAGRWRRSGSGSARSPSARRLDPRNSPMSELRVHQPVRASGTTAAPVGLPQPGRGADRRLDVGASATKAEISRGGFTLPEIAVRPDRIECYLDDRPIVQTKVVTQTIAAGTAVAQGTAIDIVLTRTDDLPVAVIPGIHTAFTNFTMAAAARPSSPQMPAVRDLVRAKTDASQLTAAETATADDRAAANNVPIGVNQDETAAAAFTAHPGGLHLPGLTSWPSSSSPVRGSRPSSARSACSASGDHRRVHRRDPVCPPSSGQRTRCRRGRGAARAAGAGRRRRRRGRSPGSRPTPAGSTNVGGIGTVRAAAGDRRRRPRTPLIVDFGTLRTVSSVQAPGRRSVR